MVYGEMGRFPMDIVIKLRMVMFWNSIIDNSGKLSSILYLKENEIHFQYEPDKNDIFFHAEVCLPIFQFQWGI
jgi:hypothetical protein